MQDNKVEERNTSFNLVHREQHDTMLINPLYNTVLNLQQQNNPIVSDLNINHKTNTNGSVFYIILADSNKLKIENYQFKEKHLTIHQYYQDKKNSLRNGLGMAHYTEIYTHLLNNESIVIHVYFTKKGFFHYVQIKHYQGDRDQQNFYELSCDSHQENEIRGYVENVSSLIENLQHQKEILYNNAWQKAAEIEHQLEKLSKTFSAELIPDYIEKAQDFIQSIEQINLYSDYIDKRGKIVQEQIYYLQQLKIAAPLPDDSLEPSPCSNSSMASNNVPERKQNGSKDTAENKFNEIKRKEKKLNELNLKITKNPYDVDLSLEQYQLVTHLTQQSLIKF